MAVGIPFVVTPVGITTEIGIENKTHFTAENNTQWFVKLAVLLESSATRRKMGENGRNFALGNYTVARQTEIIARTLQGVIGNTF